MKKQTLPEGANLRQLKIQAKELQSESGLKLSEAQFQLAKSYGFESWPKLVRHVELPSLTFQLRSAIEQGDASKVDQLLSKNQVLKTAINEPMMYFDSPPLVGASSTQAAAQIIPILVKHGADPNQRSSWWAGGFSALDHASPEVAELLIRLGAKWDVWSASKHNQIEILDRLLEENAELIDAKGGDGQTPLHFAGSVEVAQLLIQRGANLEVKDVDHESTPIQNHIKSSDIVRALLQAGAEPDIYTAVALDDVDLLERVLLKHPGMTNDRIGEPPFQTVKSNGGHVYAYVIGNGISPTQYAVMRGSHRTLEILKSRVSIGNQILLAAQAGNLSEAKALAESNPDFWIELGKDHAAVAFAAQHGNVEAVKILLELGFNPNSPGMDGGTALHLAAWYGYSEIVRLLIGRVPIEQLDPTHGSPPLGWAAHGSHFCRNPKGDYLECVRLLIENGADPKAQANKNGVTMLQQAGSRDDVKSLLKQLGA